MKWNRAIFRKNDIRGIYKKDFDLEFVKILARGFVHFCEGEGVITRASIKRATARDFLTRPAQKNLSQQKLNRLKKLKIALGHDSRLSSPEIAKELARSLTLAGADVVFLGLAPSPLCFFTSYFAKDIPAVIVVTASHNPPAFNGFKMMLNGQSICDQKILHLQTICRALHKGTGLPAHGRGRALLSVKHASSRLAKIKPRPELEIPSYKGKLQKVNIESAYISCLSFLQSGNPKNRPLGLPKKYKPFNRAGVLKGKFAQNPRIKIAVDCGNGSMGPLAQKVFMKLNPQVKVYWLYARPDGRFPHHPPDPSTTKNLKALQKTVRQKKCHFGVAFDGDGDRLRVVGKTGKILAGDELMSIFISDILHIKLFSPTDPSNAPSNDSFNGPSNASPKKNLPARIVTDVKCADWFFDFLRGTFPASQAYPPARSNSACPGSTPPSSAQNFLKSPPRQELKIIMWRSGHSLIRQKTLKEKALFGGELSGHFFFPKCYFPIDDGLYSLLRLLHICFKTGHAPEELTCKKQSFETEEIRRPIADPARAQQKLNRLKKFYKAQPHAQCSFIDGVRVSFKGRAWGVARFSNTQSEWTFRFGGKTKSDAQKLQKKFYQLLAQA